MTENSKSLVNKYISEDKLQEQIRHLEQIAKKVNRLQFIRLLYKEYSVKEATEILGIPLRTGYNWLEKWNENGIEGLDHKKGAGRPTFLTEEQIKELDEFISNGESLCTMDVHEFIKKKFNVDYSLKQVRIIINKLNYGWIKPYPVYSKSPDNAEEILKKDVSEIDPEKDIYGFFDESAFQNKPNVSKIIKKKDQNQK